MEHHANIVPWQLICERTGATIRVADLHPDGSLDLDALYAAMTPEVKLLGVAHVSNVLGTINPVAAICKEARKRGITTVVDGSQALPHMAVDIAAIGCDFYAFTGHKMCGPTGTGALWARRELLASMPPFLGGGEMIKEVRYEGTVFNDPPHRFEAGTPNIAGHIGLGAAVAYLDGIGMDAIAAREAALLAHLTEEMTAIDGVRIIGTARAQGRGRVVPRRRRACARPRHAAGPRRRRGALGPPLRASADGLLRRAGHVPRLARVLQHARRDRSLRSRPAQGAPPARLDCAPCGFRDCAAHE